jgi:hypothetical protein
LRKRAVAADSSRGWQRGKKQVRRGEERGGKRITVMAKESLSVRAGAGGGGRLSAAALHAMEWRRMASKGGRMRMEERNVRVSM